LRKLAKLIELEELEGEARIPIPSDFIEFNKFIGLPVHPATLEPTSLMPYQMEFIKLIPEKRNRLFHINKSRQIGVTELILRVLAYHCFHKYKGYKIMLIAGTREKTAAKIMRRFKKLFKNIRSEVAEDTNAFVLRLKNGSEIEALPSNSDSIRGDTRIKAIFVDEAAHFGMIDDSVVMDAIEPIVFTNRSDLYLVSTPRGKRGFFYDIATEKNEYFKVQWDYTKAIGWIYSEEEIDKELQRTDVDVLQEYQCQFTSGAGTIISEEMIEQMEEDYLLEEI